MTETSPSSNRQRKVDGFLRAVNIGTAMVVAFPLTALAMEQVFPDFEEGDPLLWPATILLFGLFCILAETYAVIACFLKRKTDEFTLSIWHTGTSWAFFAAIVWLLVGHYVETIIAAVEVSNAYQAYEAALKLNPDIGEFVPPEEEDRISGFFSVHVILFAFFLGSQFKRLRGDL